MISVFILNIYHVIIIPFVEVLFSCFCLILDGYCRFLFFLAGPYVKYLIAIVLKNNPNATPAEIEKALLFFTFVGGVFSMCLTYFISKFVRNYYL